jgi:hypothetical protein
MGFGLLDICSGGDFVVRINVFIKKKEKFVWWDLFFWSWSGQLAGIKEFI